MSGLPKRQVTGQSEITDISEARARRNISVSEYTQSSSGGGETATYGQTLSASAMPAARANKDAKVTFPRRESESDLAFTCISIAADENNDDVDRTNGFDEWKDHISSLSKKHEGVSIEHRQLLGMLLTATSSHELSELNKEAVSACQTITGLLRRPKLNEIDAKFSLRILKKSNLTVTSQINYSFDENQDAEVDSILEVLLGRA